MILAVTWGVGVLAALIILVAAIYAYCDRLIDDVMLALLALLEVGVIIQLVRGIGGLDQVADPSQRMTLLAYLVSLPVVPLGTAFLAIKEKSRWSMAAIAVGAFAVAVMMVRCQQIWDWAEMTGG